MTWVNYHHLYYFYVIAREGSIAKAARRLRLSQSTLSIQLRQLEELFDQKLFDRSKQNLMLTGTGRLVYEYAAEIFRIGSEMMEAVKNRKEAGPLRLHLGILDSIPKAMAHELVIAAYAIGDCFVSVVEAGSEELLNGLKAHALHLALTNSHAPMTSKSGLFSRCVADLPVTVFGSPRYAALRENFPQSLNGQPFLFPTLHSKLRHDLEHLFERNNLSPRIVGESQESELDKRLAASGHALIAMSSYGEEPLVQEGKIIEIGVLEALREQIWLTGVKMHVVNPIAAQLLETFTLTAP
ncbi:LysR family transcriptional regulator [Oligoflexus tunisiensis]|uniref:LysR family transcriptional regulator n=1 Tax=Oligoflexus tunisiensis TaxID=708132 RepID=UPI00114D0C54|nr:LysR family transcriptional regulator [Oligoflexus tunisiensis]